MISKPLESSTKVFFHISKYLHAATEARNWSSNARPIILPNHTSFATCPCVKTCLEEFHRETSGCPHASRARTTARDISTVVPVGAVVEEEHGIDWHTLSFLTLDNAVSLVARIDLAEVDQVLSLSSRESSGKAHGKPSRHALAWWVQLC